MRLGFLAKLGNKVCLHHMEATGFKPVYPAMVKRNAPSYKRIN
jgi:hypothetical protein